MKQNFIRTNDKETAEKLLALGFQKIDEQNGFFVFLNCSNLKFSEEDKNLKFQYTNILNI